MRLAGPLILIAIGVLFLLNNTVLNIPLREGIRDFWPFFLILIGLLRLLSFFFGGPTQRFGSLIGGGVMITVGTLFAIQQQLGIAFHSTWPVLLVVIGILGVVRALAGRSLLASRGGRFTRGLR